jgi:hypothetical protein
MQVAIGLWGKACDNFLMLTRRDIGIDNLLDEMARDFGHR